MVNLSDATLYFGYGSNLWKDQMKRRCPTSKYLGIARLKGYRWIIYNRGYANIVEEDKTEDVGSEEYSYAHEVWGLVYSLQPDDEKSLDKSEGVPVAYTKENIKVEFWPASGKKEGVADEKPVAISSLVYINRVLKDTAEPKKEYIYRMNMGIRDALEEGVPKAYVDQVMRKFIPDREDETVKNLALQQALQFKDER